LVVALFVVGGIASFFFYPKKETYEAPPAQHVETQAERTAKILQAGAASTTQAARVAKILKAGPISKSQASTTAALLK